MFTRISLVAWALLAAAGVEAKHHSISKENGDIAVNSDIGRNLLKHARRVQDENGNYESYDWNNVDTSFLAGYSVKFQGCHHVQQWNPDAQDEDDVRIMTKRLVRFRLCPSSDCMSDLSGCTSKYGDYVVDMGTYVAAYMESGMGYNGQGQYQGQGQQGQGGRQLEFQMEDFAECGQLDRRRHLDQNGYQGQQGEGQYWYEDDRELYVGPYCADQGGEIRLGVFTDDTCTAFAQNGESSFYQAAGYSLPFSTQSMVSMSCMSCGNYMAYGQENGQGNGQENGEGNGQEAYINEFCEDIYAFAGKCETKMNVPYPNESSCSYIEGIKIIREDGVIRTAATKKSKAAAVCIGLFLTIAVLLAGYVYYLRTKLGRAKINLAAASQTLS